MTKAKIMKMLKEIVEELDYDIYKDIFVYKERDDNLETLVKIVEKYMK